MTQKINAPVLSDLRMIRTREALRDGLLTLLEQKPLEQIVVRDITAAARVGYATFYRHYSTKEALLDELAKNQVHQLVELTLPVMNTNSLAACIALLSYVNEHRALWTTLLTGGAAGTIKQEMLRVSREIAVTRSGIENWSVTELKVILVVSCMVEALAWWLSQPHPLAVEEVAKILDSTMVSLS